MGLETEGEGARACARDSRVWRAFDAHMARVLICLGRKAIVSGSRSAAEQRPLRIFTMQALCDDERVPSASGPIGRARDFPIEKGIVCELRLVARAYAMSRWIWYPARDGSAPRMRPQRVAIVP